MHFLDKDYIVLRLYKARIHSNVSDNDIRLRVRILPHFEMIPKYQEDYLPLFPPLNSHEVIRGKTEKDDGINNADQVLVLSNEEFTFGWIVCLLGNTYKNRIEDIDNPPMYDYDTLYDFLSSRGMLSSEESKFENLYIFSFHDAGEGSGHFIGYDKKTGEIFSILSSGTAVIQNKNKIELYVSAKENSNLLKTSVSRITMTPDKIKFSAEHVIFDTPDLRLGKRNLYALGVASRVPVSTGGQSLQPVDTVRL